MEIKKAVLLMVCMFLLGMLSAAFVYLYNQILKEKRESNEDPERRPKFFIESGLKQLSCLNEDGTDKETNRTWRNRWKENKIPLQHFERICLVLPMYFAQSFLASHHWVLLVTNSNHDEGWFDLVLKKRREPDIKIRLHYFDIETFNEGCNKVIGYDMAKTLYLSKQITEKAKSIKTQMNEGE